MKGAVQGEIIATGLNPAIGVMHSASENRVPLVYDLMEPLRPMVERKVLEFALEHSFTPADFTINSWGRCRLNPQMAKVVAGRLATIIATPVANGFLRQVR